MIEVLRAHVDTAASSAFCSLIGYCYCTSRTALQLAVRLKHFTWLSVCSQVNWA